MKQLKLKPISIAILPFQNMSPTEDLDYLVNGFSEDLITDLSRYSSLQVISSHSSNLPGINTGDQHKLIPKLNVDYLVKGSFLHTDKNVRINVQLVLVREDVIIWSNRHKANIENILEILDEVTEELVSTLQRQVDINLLAASKSKPQTNLAAYEYWLMGMEELKKGTLDSDNVAREFFQKAIDVDCNYGRAYAGLSMSYFNEWSCQLWERWDYSQKGAFEYALKAIELDETNYLSMTVLGRLYIYKGEWERAEHFLRKSLRFNPNDTDNLMQIASCFIYLGYSKEAEKLYFKALRLNPINTDWYFSFAAMLYFEMGNYKKCIDLGLKTNFKTVMVDMAAFISGAYYHLGEYEKMHIYWQEYLAMFKEKILRGNKVIEEEALRWILNINPYKGESNLIPFLDYMIKKSGYSITQITPQKTGDEKSGHVFQHTGRLWEMRYDGKTVMMPEVKGYNDISRLLSMLGQEVHCLELMGSAVKVGESELVIDDKAKIEYRERISQLQQDIEEAQLMNDIVRSRHLNEEYDNLVDQLSKSLGLGGKQRKIPNHVDKARSAVTWRIRSAIKKINESHEALGKHFAKSLKTGTFCSYNPEKKIDWEL